jgi:hypothetical protein
MLNGRVLGAVASLCALLPTIHVSADAGAGDGLARGLLTVPRWAITAAAIGTALAAAAMLWRNARGPRP